jgi:hypothetical protein
MQIQNQIQNKANDTDSAANLAKQMENLPQRVADAYNLNDLKHVYNFNEELKSLRNCRDNPAACIEAENRLANFFDANSFEIAKSTSWFSNQDMNEVLVRKSYIEQLAKDLREAARQTSLTENVNVLTQRQISLIENVNALAQKFFVHALYRNRVEELFLNFSNSCKDFRSRECSAAREELAAFLYDNKDKFTQQLTPGGENDLDGLKNNFGVIIDAVKGLRDKSVN